MGVRTQTPRRPLADAELPDRYRLIRLIARGGMGTVWCAEDLVLGRRVALKLLADHFVNDERAVRRFKREARTAGRLSGHPNIVTIFDVGQTIPESDATPGRPFIVMEHLPCGSVADALRVREVRPDDPVRWLREAAAALDYAHAQGVVHRDIKPANLLLDRQRSLHVGDFGIARIGTEETITGGGQLFGTAAYLSPEQALGKRATEASDRYALAVVAYELLTGERPFKGQHFAAQARGHIEEPPPRASSVQPVLAPAVDGVLIRALSKRPEERWPTAAEFADAVAAALRKPPVRRRPPAGATRPARTAATAVPLSTPAERRGPHPRGIAVAALAAAALAAGVAVSASHGGSPSGRSAASISAAQHAAATKPAKRDSRRHSTPARASSSGQSAAGGSQPAASGGSAASAQSRSPSAAVTSGSADALEARGHQLMLGGHYSEAIGVLRQAVAAAPRGSLTYAYALYDLGRSLRLGGDPAAAVPILRERLRIPNQTDVVRHELALALEPLGGGSGGAAPAPASASGGAAPVARASHAAEGKHGAPGRVKHKRGDGGD